MLWRHWNYYRLWSENSICKQEFDKNLWWIFFLSSHTYFCHSLGEITFREEKNLIIRASSFRSEKCFNRSELWLDSAVPTWYISAMPLPFSCPSDYNRDNWLLLTAVFQYEPRHWKSHLHQTLNRISDSFITTNSRH